MKSSKVKVYLFAFLLVALSSTHALSQGLPAEPDYGEDKLGNWIMYFGLNRISDRWSIHTEAQWRNHTVDPDLEQLLLRTGMNYHINDEFMATAGYAYILSEPYEETPGNTGTSEHRIFQQFIIKNKLSSFNFEHRYRYEQRWVESYFLQRGRYRLMVSVPLNKKVIEKGSIIFAVYDEIFINIDKNLSFDRNRLFGAFGYQFSKSTGVQVGLMKQSVPTFSKTYLQFALFLNPDFRK